MKKIGILDIQGSVSEHLQSLRRLKEQGGLEFEIALVKRPEDLKGVVGMIAPGGESTTIGKLLRRFGLREAILEQVAEGMALWGTCAGAILVAKEIKGKQKADTLELVDVVVERNAYGRQLDSFETEIEFEGKLVPAVFIRAPKIHSLGDDVVPLALHGGEVVACRQGRLLVTTFHPELTENLQVHRFFVENSLKC